MSCDDKILGRTDRQTDRRSDPTPRPAFAFGDEGKKELSHLSEGRSSLKETNELPSTHKEVNKCH